MLQAFGSVLTVLAIIAIGIFLTKKGWFDDKASALIARLVLSLSLPAYLVSNLLGGYDRAKLLSMAPGLPVPFIAMGLGYVLARITAAVFKIRTSRRGAFSSMFALSNSIFIGLPVNFLLFGERSLPYVLLYYMANTILFWTVSVYGISRDGAEAAGRKAPPFLSVEALKRFLSPPFLGLLVAITLIMLRVRLPKPVLGLLATLGAMTTPLSMIFIGISIARVDWRRLRLERDLVLVLAGRFVVSPLILVLIARGTELPTLMKQVFLVQAMMPAMTQTPIVAAGYGADAEYAGIATSLSTAISLATIPLCLVLARAVF